MTFRGAAVIMLGLAYACASRGTQEAKTVKLFYLPFGAETYVPVTRQTIEKDATCIFELAAASAEAGRLTLLLQSGTESGFDDRVVRLKIIGLFPETVCVNQDGEVIREPARVYRLSDGTFAELKLVMEGLFRAHRCR